MKAGKLTYGVYARGPLGYCVSRHRTYKAAEKALAKLPFGQQGYIRLSALNRVGWAHF